ncbi:N-acetylglucosamine kinase [Sporosarcina sp. NPDC096371]|uniref:N-acetylglucosamine kinase n=1 Tax=Sporosarcina sp. NPDC096371 TaxID=3364530 RepID=UPI003808BDDF
MTTYLLAIDGGGTKTVGTLRDNNGVILYEGASTGSNYQVIGAAAFTQVVQGMLEKLLETFPVSMVDVGVFALAGIDTPEDYAVVHAMIVDVLDELSLTVIDLVVENDAYATLVGVTRNQSGILLIAGTGSIAYAHDGKGIVARSGGWGHRAGDEGSGYWMGKQIVSAIFRMEDGRGPATVLKDKVLAQLGLQTVDDLTAWLYGDQYSVDAVARLSTVLDEAIDLGDGEATRILCEAGDELTGLATAVIHSAKLTDRPCTLYVTGGVLENFDRLFQLVKTKVEQMDPLKQVVLCEGAPVDAIYHRALVRFCAGACE